jgi:hypothetical protein
MEDVLVLAWVNCYLGIYNVFGQQPLILHKYNTSGHMGDVLVLAWVDCYLGIHNAANVFGQQPL